MPRLPRISSREAIRALERLGFEQIRQTGSHVVMKRATDKGEVGCVVPLHRELKLGTVRKTLSFSKFLEHHSGAIWSFIHPYDASLPV